MEGVIDEACHLRRFFICRPLGSLGLSRQTCGVWWSSEALFRPATGSIVSQVIEGRPAEPFTDTNTPSLSIAQADWVLNDERELALPVSQKADSNLLALHETLLAAVTIRVGEVEAAEWALDQAKTACDVEIAAALAAGVPAEKILLVAGDLASIPPELAENTEPRPADR